MSLSRAALRRLLVERSKELLVLSNRNQTTRFLGLRAYDAMRLVISQRLRSVEGVRAVYLCHSLATGECYPGLSDFDLAIVFDGRDPPAFYDRMRARWGLLKRYLPISDVSILTVDEFTAWQRIGGGWDPLDEVRHWKLLAGDELRSAELDLTSDSAGMDRVQWALGHFQNLLHVAVREERQSPLMAVVARRQLYKCFWNAVLALDPESLALPMHRERVRHWMGRNGDADPVAALEEMHRRRFLTGPVTTLRLSAAASAYRMLDESLATNPLVTRPLTRPVVDASAEVPLANLSDVERRARTISARLVEFLGDRMESLILSSTGTARGYALYVVLRDGLAAEQVARALGQIRVVHRVFDDPWFNEHFPAAIPIVCSPAMFRARLQTARSSLHYFEKFRRVLYGVDLYAAMTSPSCGTDNPERPGDWRREQLLFSILLHQIYLMRLKPALHDYVTFYFPRLILQRHGKVVPATAEEAVAAFARLSDRPDADAPGRLLADYRGKDVDVLTRTMERSAFTAMWPMLRQGLHSEISAA